MSIEKITSTILAEAEEQQKAALEEAQAKCDQIIAEAHQKAKEYTEAMVRRDMKRRKK